MCTLRTNFFLASEAQEFSSFHNIHRWRGYSNICGTLVSLSAISKGVYLVLSRINKRCKQLIIRCLFTPSCCPEDHWQTFLSWTKFLKTPFILAFCEQYPCKFRKHDTVLSDSFWDVILTSCIIIKEEKLSYFSGNHLISISSCLPLLIGCVAHTPLRKRPSFPFSTRFLWKFGTFERLSVSGKP